MYLHPRREDENLVQRKDQNPGIPPRVWRRPGFPLTKTIGCGIPPCVRRRLPGAIRRPGPVRRRRLTRRLTTKSCRETSTRVEKTYDTSPSSGGRGGYLHPRGEDEVYLVVDVAADGLPPPAWRRLRTSLANFPGSRSTSTRVEKTGPRPRCPRSRGGNLHPRGENRFVIDTHRGLIGIPPSAWRRLAVDDLIEVVVRCTSLMWRRLSVRAHDRQGHRNTSTYVEKTRSPSELPRRVADYLHACGEDYAVDEWNEPQSGKPPPAWRRPLRQQVAEAHKRDTSTRVEKTRWRVGHDDLIRGYLHPPGEDLGLSSSVVRRTGKPPPA